MYAARAIYALIRCGHARKTGSLAKMLMEDTRPPRVFEPGGVQSLGNWATSRQRGC